MLFKHKKIEHVIYMYIVTFMQDNYPSSYDIISLFDF